MLFFLLHSSTLGCFLVEKGQEKDLMRLFSPYILLLHKNALTDILVNNNY